MTSAPPPWTVPAGWVANWEPSVDLNSPLGAPILRGWVVRREACAALHDDREVCSQVVGYRLDLGEVTWGISGCRSHRNEAKLVLQAVQTMPGQDEGMVELAARLLEEAIAS